MFTNELIFAHITAGNGPVSEFGIGMSVGLRIWRLSAAGFNRRNNLVGNGSTPALKARPGLGVILGWALNITNRRISNSDFMFCFDVYFIL